MSRCSIAQVKGRTIVVTEKMEKEKMNETD